MSKPVLVMESPSFMGIGNMEDREDMERIKAHRGHCVLHGGRIDKCYVHGPLESKMGFDLAQFASGVILDQEEQEVILFDVQDKPHEAVLVIVKRPNNERWALIVQNIPDEIKKAKEYLNKAEYGL